MAEQFLEHPFERRPGNRASAFTVPHPLQTMPEHQGVQKCYVCHRWYRDFERLKRHAGSCICRSSVHSQPRVVGRTKKRPFGCDMCEKHFKTNLGLTVHKNISHLQSDTLQAQTQESTSDLTSPSASDLGDNKPAEVTRGRLSTTDAQDGEHGNTVSVADAKAQQDRSETPDTHVQPKVEEGEFEVAKPAPNHSPKREAAANIREMSVDEKVPLDNSSEPAISHNSPTVAPATPIAPIPYEQRTPPVFKSFTEVLDDACRDEYEPRQQELAKPLRRRSAQKQKRRRESVGDGLPVWQC